MAGMQRHLTRGKHLCGRARHFNSSRIIRLRTPLIGSSTLIVHLQYQPQHYQMTLLSRRSPNIQGRSVRHLAYCSTWRRGVPLIWTASGMTGCRHFPSLLQRFQSSAHGEWSGSGAVRSWLFVATIGIQSCKCSEPIPCSGSCPRIPLF